MRNPWLVSALAIVIGVGGAAGIAVAQVGDGRETVVQSASEMYDVCVARGGEATECACTAGFYGGRLRADEFRMVSVLSRHIGADGEISDMTAALEDMRSEARAMGMTDPRFLEVMDRFSTLDRDGAYGDNVCVVLRDK